VHTGQEAEVAGFGLMADIWGQSAGEWKANRKRVIASIA